MTSRNSGTNPDALISEWHGKAWLKRMFLPGDFLENVSKLAEENMVCRKTTMDYLVMSDQVESKALKTKDARKYSTDEDYRPQEFKKETLKIITDAVRVRCYGCSGLGEVSCGHCAGSGEVRCDTMMNCRSCGGSGKSFQSCASCGGSGKINRGYQGRYGHVDNYESCSPCWGSGKRDQDCLMCSNGKVTCDRCGGRGRVVCDRCSGSGEVVCGQCDGSGELVEANIITRKFERSTTLTHQLSGLAADEFKNGLAEKHFKSPTGDLIHEEFQTPATNDIVLQRQSIHSYDVLSHRYSFKGAEFWLNRISSGNGLKYAPAGLPFSRTRMAVAGGVLLGIALAAVAAVSVLTLL